jgi:6-phosphogluconolactonase (cycloisomerase 2 family)
LLLLDEQRHRRSRQGKGVQLKFEDSLRQIGFQGLASRRAFLKTSAALCLAYSTTKPIQGLALDSGGRRTLAYVGTDTKPVDGAANGKGIYLFEMNPRTGELLLLKLAAETASPSWLTFHPTGRYLYAINEVSDFDGKNGSVSAFAIDRTNGDLRFLNTVSSQGAGPAYVSVDATGKYAFVANYFGGNIAVLPILPNGSLGPAVDFHQDKGFLGSIHATNGPPGSFAISGHDAPHAHMIHPDPKNRFVLQTDLGQDRIYIYKFDAGSGKLTAANTPFVSFPSGDGPRHFAFHPNGEWMYSIQEEASTVVFFLYDSRTGALRRQQTVSTLPSGYTGTNFSSEITVSPDGRFLYAANRLHNSIAVFSIAKDGRLDHAGDILTQGDYPSYFTLAPGGKFLYACNQRSDQITAFRIHRKTGLLAFTGQYTPAGTPLCLAFLK